MRQINMLNVSKFILQLTYDNIQIKNPSYHNPMYKLFTSF
jgi:hypothetical protein